MIRALVFALVIGVPVNAAAQGDDPAPRRHRFTLAGGGSWLGGYSIGGGTATLRRNEPGTLTPGAFTLFRADVSMKRAVTVDARIGYALTRELAVEAGGSFGRPRVAAAISQDVEAQPAVLSDERISQYVVEGSVIWQLSRGRLGAHARPYVTGGAGYLRQLYGDRVKAETGTLVHLGTGVRYWLRGGDATHRALGIRGEARVQARSGGVELAGKTRIFPAVHLLGFFGF